MYDRSGVHKVSMVRMFYKNRQNSECKGLKWYIAEMLYPPNNVGFVRISKICGYENPYTVTGSIKQTGS